ncbi:hypothetical protein ACWFMI_23425 [Nocardiopsis terrae]|uniref:hypothetical protein n=1 Tax=Streptomyces sp. NPDC057554 TaxID=3350538 RepID=UPI00367509A4
MRTPITLAAATVLLLTAACSTDDEQPETSPEESSVDSPDQDETHQEEGDGTTVLDLEETHTYDDGFEIGLSDFERFNEQDEGYSDDTDWMTFTVTFTNGTDAPVEIDRIERSCQVNGQVSDYEAFDHLAYEWPSMIQPGSTGTWQPACEMPTDADELQWDMAVFTPVDEMGPSYPTVYWAGSVD